MNACSTSILRTALVVWATTCPILAAPRQATPGARAVEPVQVQMPAPTFPPKAKSSTIPLAPPTPNPISSLPFTISTPGYYRVTADLTGVSGDHGIVVDSSDVVIDLDGFTLIGVPGSLTGISANQAEHVTVLNGSVVLWGAGGLDLGQGTRLFGLRVTHNQGDGVVLTGDALVEECKIHQNSEMGIFGQSSLTVRACVVRQNGADGVRAFDDARIVDSLLVDNGDDGVHLGDHAHVTGCFTKANSGAGVRTGKHAVVLDTVAENNVASGFDVAESSRLVRCIAHENGKGITAGTTSHIADCTATSNGLEGITGLEGTLVQRCIVSDNQHGIILFQAGCRVSDCKIERNVDDGLGLSGNSTAERNSVQGNGSRGIFAMSTGNRIDGNDVAENGVGIAVLTGNNLIVRNTLAFNGVQLQIAADNMQGPFLKAKGFIQDTNPWANFDLSFPTTFP